MSDNFFMVIESNYSQIKQNFDIFNSSLKVNQAYLNTKNQELSQYLGIDIFHSYIEQNKFLNLIWTKFNTMLDDKKKMQLSLEEKVIERNNILIQEQQNQMLDLQIENKNLKSNLEKVLRKIITKNTKQDIAENLYMNKNFSKLNLNTNNLLSGNLNAPNNPSSLSTTKSQRSLLSAVNNSKSKSKSKSKTSHKNNLNSNLKESSSKNNLKHTVNGYNKTVNNCTDLKGLNTINTSIDDSKNSNGENSNPNANEKLNKMKFNLNKFIEKISAEGVINKANLIPNHPNDNLNMSVNVNFNYPHNNDMLNSSHFINKSYNIDIDRELNNLLNESHSNIYSQNNNLIKTSDRNQKNFSKQKLYEKRQTPINNQTGNNNGNSTTNANKNSINTGGPLLKGSQSMANFNDLATSRKGRDSSIIRTMKKDTGMI